MHVGRYGNTLRAIYNSEQALELWILANILYCFEHLFDLEMPLKGRDAHYLLPSSHLPSVFSREVIYWNVIQM